MTPAISTITRMLEELPEETQDRVVDRLREYIEELQDEILWDKQFASTQPALIAAAQQARKERNAGLAKPLNLDQL